MNWQCEKIAEEFEEYERTECQKYRKYLDILYEYLYREYVGIPTVKPKFVLKKQIEIEGQIIYPFDDAYISQLVKVPQKDYLNHELGAAYFMRMNWHCDKIPREFEEECQKNRKYLHLLYEYLFRLYVEGKNADLVNKLPAVKPIFMDDYGILCISELIKLLYGFSKCFVNRIDIIREWNLIEEIDKLLEHCQSSKSDVVLLSVNLKMDPPTGRSFPFNDVLLVKNDEYDLAVPIKINKKLLALHSSFFDRLFFNNTEGSSSSYSSSSISFQPVVQLRPATVNYQPILQLNPPSTRENFYRMLLVLQYGDSFLKDTNVEDILRLAVRYEIDEVQGKCAKFLLDPKCQKTKLGSFRIAFSHGLNITKDLILKSMTREDFSEGKNLIEHHKEMEMLSTEASHEFNERYHQLFPEAQKDHKNKKQKVGQMDIDGPMIDN
ncbi:hypothetical protein niasHS_011726 [Heterodera schachtii]|uniref:BTB domain-containing protein n=1 Tax=Heterodera schachtii TaxID=97005 RepID=A0ABD2IC14_HETSC